MDTVVIIYIIGLVCCILSLIGAIAEGNRSAIFGWANSIVLWGLVLIKTFQ